MVSMGMFHYLRLYKSRFYLGWHLKTKFSNNPIFVVADHQWISCCFPILGYLQEMSIGMLGPTSTYNYYLN